MVSAFQSANLPVRNQRDNSKNCEDLGIKCSALIKTDDISVYTFDDKAAQLK